MTFILASGSPRRRELLASLGVRFTVIKSDIDETQHPGEPPLDYVRRLSIEKAHAVAANVFAAQPDAALILAADTVVILAADTMGILDGDILGKPTDADDARVMLERLRGRAHIVCTALTLLRCTQGAITKQITRLTQTTVTMRHYSDAEIAAYIASGDPFDKAGSYAIQHEGFHPVERIDGSYTNVVGLPVETLRVLLDEIEA
ncbi:MAG: septum formation protein Maf [Anaerolinea sp.]|nr:septum formation protein Maf [Anaerolinea sp.]